MKKNLLLYKQNNTWLFDDPGKAVCNEPFVEGSSEILSELQNQLGLSGNTLTIEFSDAPFEGHQHVLQWKNSRDAGTWNLYYSEELQMEGWLCPVLLKYFDDAPKKLFLKIF